MKRSGILLLLAVSFIARLLVATLIELNNDEVYYWTYAQHLQWNYFDHPPGIAVLIRIFTVNLSFQQPLFLRLGSIFCTSASTWLVYAIGARINNHYTGLIAAVLFTASPYCSLIAGVLVMPDAPQLVFWLASVLLMLKITSAHTRRNRMPARLLLLGVTTGCCILCKVHGIFLWIGFFSYVFLFNRKLLRNIYLFYAVVISAIIVSPILLWNLDNDFISYRFHSERVSFFGKIQADSFFRELGGEALYSNPVVFVLIIVATVAAFQRKILVTAQVSRLLLALSLPMIGAVLLMAVFRDTLPHWTGPAYATLLPLAAAYIAKRFKPGEHPVLKGAVKWSIALLGTALPLALAIIYWLPFNIGNKERLQLGDGDPLLDMSGFSRAGIQFDSIYHSDLSKGRISSQPVIITDNWFPAAHLDYYFARPAQLGFMAIGNLKAIHHYAWLNAGRPGLAKEKDAYYITVSNHFRPPSKAITTLFDRADTLPQHIMQYRGGAPVRYFAVYRLYSYKGILPANGVIQ
jgi:Dolichyl-phosphate-mannose-protein mannosyltransferase